MIKYFFTILFTCLAINVFADVPRLSRGDLRHVSITTNHVPNTTSIEGIEMAQSQQKFIQFGSRAVNIEELEGLRIASTYAFNFDWDYDTQIAIVNESSYALKGISCEITQSSSTDNEFILSRFYDDTKIPIRINFSTGLVTIKAGIPLDTITDTVVIDPNPIRNNAYNTQYVPAIRIRTIYAMPLSWLTGDDDDYNDIFGQVEEDGSITLEEFAFLVKEKILGVESWELSPIFKYTTLIKPNGSHSCTFSEPFSDQWFDGLGGLVPRKPGTSKPVSPRPFVSEIVNKKTVINFNSVIGIGNGGVSTDSMSPGSIDPEYVLHYMKIPVYVKTINESTFIVYNLYGLGNGCVMKIGLGPDDGMVYIPRQEVYNDGLGHVYYNDTISGVSTGSWRKTISWSKTSLYDKDDNGQYHELDRTYTNNSLVFSDSVPNKPVITSSVTASKVRFIALASAPSVPILYSYDNETGNYYQVTNPVSFSRESEPYKIYLAAKALDLYTFMHSEMTILEYEIPALDVPITILRGDVNGDTLVDISDVTALIDHILSGDFDDSDTFNSEAADCIWDGSINISDVTTLIDYLLSGHWSD